MAGGVNHLDFSIVEHSQRRRAKRAMFRWIRGFLFHDPNIALKPSRFAVEISEKGELVKGSPADSREDALDLLERLQGECRSIGVRAFLVKLDAPSHFASGAAGS